MRSRQPASPQTGRRIPGRLPGPTLPPPPRPPSGRCPRPRREAASVPRARAAEILLDFPFVAALRPGKRGGAIVVAMIDVGALADQQASRLRVVLADRHHQ